MTEALRAAYFELAALIPRPDDAKVTDWPVENPADAECLQKAYDVIRAALAKARGAA